MSGSPPSAPTRLAGEPDGRLAHLLRVVDRLHTPASRAAVIGGLAVLIRVGSAYRVTDDVDHVAAPDDPLALVVAEQGRAVVGASSSWLIDDVKIDIIEVGSTPAAAVEAAEWPDDMTAKVFAVSHQWALDSAAPVQLEVWGDSGRRVLTTEVPVASIPALLAMKLQSAPRRSAGSSQKKGSDYLDAFRLLTSTEGRGELDTTMRDLQAAPAGLGDWIIAELDRAFDDDAERTVRSIAAASNLPTDQRVRPEDLRRIVAASRAST